ncbi:MAG: bifunctional 3-demethylubiquinol 3-O-methyltransferase/2-polyprenyl-6-hydroxyphenol methylase [Rhodospirillales bacterium RIFCSPLOWO2_12_FULL_58_28]|nr:MAG: bifunctional 3-demethylubiquinol 3-O-methyltransferase/2-polyprenyl-6-hydroxyphenol methylase [Rhodospirillales bacterium RIFCSPLOWO2_02_FULL_58_16]OHC77271.1 MAG: bifunctional 3-demethylubiquinol 3-O-methyltransferase/2-polyprenyl-6-hydroxyphenol methylase [Rhodospirillales bacterium RIFCSPLOWO2_12_FULL_58_28]
MAAARESERGTASPDEVARFSAMADAWWEPNGKFKPLHELNPPRIAFIRDFTCARFKRDAGDEKPFAGLSILDIGCGGGLLSEPMKRLGAAVTGIDASEKNIAVARLHAEKSGLEIDYRCAPPEDLIKDKKRFDLVLAMEVVEHVADLDAFFKAGAELVRPGGVMAVSTLNRTMKSFLLAKVASEYILRWLPVGTHDWNKFVKPSELVRGLEPFGVKIIELSGVAYNPLSGEWRLSRDLTVNYMAFGVKE